MALVNWNPVTAANFSESNALRLAAQQQLAGGIKGIGDTAVAFNDATGKANTDILLNSLVGQRTPEAAAAAIQAAKAQAGGMYSNYDQAAFRSAAEALPKSAADAQELDFQTADKPYLQAATLAFSKGDPEAVAHFASQVKSNAGRAELAKLIGDSNTMGNQAAIIAETHRKNIADEVQAKTNGYTARIAANNTRQPRGQSTAAGIASLLKVAENLKRTRSAGIVDKAITEQENSLKGKTAFDTTIAKNYHPIMGQDAQSLHELYMKNPAYASAGWDIKNQALTSGLAYAASQHPTTGFAVNDTLMSKQLDVTMGDIANTRKLRNDAQIAADMSKVDDSIDAWALAHNMSRDQIPASIIQTLQQSVLDSNPIQDAVAPPPSKPTKETEQYLKDKADNAAREAKRQAELAAGKGNPTSVKGGVVTTPRYPVSAGNPITNDPILKAAATAVKSVGTAVANTTNATPNTSMLQGGGNGFLDRPVAPVNTNGLTTIAKGVDNLATTSVPEAVSKVVASITSKPSNTSFVDNNFALVAAAQAKAKPQTPTVIKNTVKQNPKGTTPIVKSSQSGTWETMFKGMADKANEVISGKGWSNDPKNQDQYENGLIVDGETTQPSSKHEINIFGMWDKDNSIKSQFLGGYDTFKGYAVKVKVKGGEEYVIPITYDEIATHTGADVGDIRSAGTNDIRGNAVVQRRVYRTALDKLNTQLSNSKGK